jgi:CBS domain
LAEKKSFDAVSSAHLRFGGFAGLQISSFLFRPSLMFVGKEDATVQLWSLAVQQAAVFDPISVKPETTLKEAAELMLRWHVGGLPVADDQK